MLLSFIANLALAQDVWLQNHFSPNSGIQLSSSENVTVLVNNNSGVIMPSNTIQVNYTINGGATVSQMLSSNLTAGASWNFTFSVKANLSVYGTYIIKVWVVRAGDVNQLNDTLQWTVQNDCIVMNQPQNMSVDHNAQVPVVNFTSSSNEAAYFWTNTNPAIGLSSSGVGNLPAFTAVNKRGVPVTSTITVTPKYNISNTFSYTGNMQTFVVPAGVTSIKVDVKGSQGESAIYNQPGTKPDDLGGKGGRVTAEYPVTAGQTLYIFVGGIGYNGGGNGGGGIAQPKGGGASDIRIGGMALTNRIIIAGGGGGGGNNCSNNAEPGGSGGNLVGGTGYQCGSQAGTAVGQGGTQMGGGAAGTSPATAGILGIGGDAGGAGTASGGGGGGYYGGGGAAYGGGGGGSSYTDPLATSVQHTQGFQEGLGEVIISYYQQCPPSNDKIFNITVNPSSQPNANGILFVKKGSTGTGNAWNNAIGELADALLVAKDLNATAAGSVTQIWVAGGTYKPLYSPEDGVNFGTDKGSDNAFLLVKDVKLYGGFGVTETQLNNRNWQLNPTILSGEIQGDAIMTNNAYHVVIAAGDVGSTTLDGFTITEGSGINSGNIATITVNSFPFFKRVAGGIYNNNSSLLVKNCIITNNSGYEASGFGSQAGNPVLINTVISKNKNIYNFYSNAFYAYSGSPKLVNVSIVNNEGTLPIFALGSNSELSNSIVWGNTVLGTPQSFLNLIIKNSIVQREAVIRVGLDIDPLFVNAANGDFSLLAESPAIGAGDNSLYEAVGNNSLATDKDLMGNTRLKGANIDLGAYELQTQPQHLSFAPTATVVYGTPDFDPGASSTTANPITYVSTNTAVATIVNGKIHTVGVGSTTIKATQAASPGYDAATAEQLLTITAKSVTVSIKSSATITKIYDGITNATILATDLTLANGDIINGDNVQLNLNTATAQYDTKHIGTAKEISLDINPLSLGGTAAGNYTINKTSPIISANVGEITVSAITVTAQTDTKVYDGAVTSSAIPVITSGAIAAVDQVSTAASQTFDNKNMGTGKVLTPTGLIITDGNGGSNYQIAYVAVSTGAITAKPITVTAIAKNKVYGDPDPALTYTSSPALAAGDNFTGALTRLAGENIGNYAIAQGTLALNNNYVITYNGANLSISTKMVTVTAQVKNKMYGDVDLVLTYTSNPALVAGDNFTGVLTRAVGESVGNYAITQGTLALSPNYTINYTANSLNITRRTMIVTADAQNKIYGEADPILTYTSANLIGADTFTGVLTRIPGENIGTYAINQGSLTAGTNYDVVFLSANFVIKPKKVTVSAEAKHKIYGDIDPVLTYSTTGLSTGDALTGSLTRAVGEHVGVYQINKGTLSVSSNYTLDYVGADFTINKKSITVTADAKRKTYGETDPILSYTFVPALIAGNSFTGALGRTTGENAGSYQITQGTLTAGDNYSINYQPGSFTLDKAVLLAKANDAQMCQGSGLPIFGLSYSGFKNGDGEGSIANRPTVGTIANNGSAAGSYTLIPSGGATTNYSFNYVNGTLTINALPQVSIASSNGSNISKGETLQLTASGGTSYSWSGLGGIVTGQNSAVLTIRPTISGTYTVTVTNANGCSSQQTFAVTVRDDFQAIKATNLLSPNGDGINDLWKVDNIDMYPGNVVTVFDRGGRVLYSKKGYDNSWNGTVNGVALAEGTYYYVIDFGSGKLKQKGFITLLRESGR